MQLTAVNAVEKKGNDAVKRLREIKHAAGLPFMITSQNIPDKQCYLDYPDGRMELVMLKMPTDHDFTLVRNLSSEERAEILNNFLLR